MTSTTTLQALIEAQHIVELFAGPGGYSEALARLGIRREQSIGIEWDADACKTAEKAGHDRLQADVAKLDPVSVAGVYFDGQPVTGFHASPPCQGFSKLGKGDSRKDSEQLLAAIMHIESGAFTPDEAIAWLRLRVKDARTVLTLEVLRWIDALRPEWVTLEQVPQVIALWEAMARVLRVWGYDVVTGVLRAEQYGVPQARQRAILIASRVGSVRLPEPTHSKFHIHSNDRLDDGVKPWVSMARALAGQMGWPLDHTDRDAVIAHVEKVVNNQSGTTFDYAWPCDRPAPTIAGRGLVTMPGANANRFNGSTKSRNDGIRATVAELGVLQGFPANYPWQGTKDKQFEQVGNAVPVALGMAVARAAIEADEPAYSPMLPFGE